MGKVLTSPQILECKNVVISKNDLFKTTMYFKTVILVRLLILAKLLIYTTTYFLFIHMLLKNSCYVKITFIPRTTSIIPAVITTVMKLDYAYLFLN